MALKDLKSELSKFRIPKKEPLENKVNVDVKKTQNQTPLTDMAESAPKIPRSTTTVNKEGVNPQKMDNSEKFLGETTPNKFDNSEKFLGETSPSKMDNSEKFLGETSPSPMDTSEQYLGETTPKSKDNTGQFLGETNPKPMSLEERYLGQTTPTPKDNTGQFLGETNPNTVQQGDKFKGETTTDLVTQGDKFKGETDPNKFDNSSNFVRFSNEKISSPFATEPDKMNLDAKFLGETTPNPSDASSKFLGETTPTPSDASSKFLGETTPNPMNIPNGEKSLGETTPTPKDSTGQFLGETTTTSVSQGDKNKGETTPSDFTFTGKLENEGKDFKEVNYFEDIHATGFNSKFGGVDATKFIGINPNNTVFDSTNSLYSDYTTSINGLSYSAGYGKFKLSKTTGNVQRYNTDTQYYSDSKLTNPSIAKLQEQRNSPSFLDEMYHKFNLRDDAFNLGTAAFAHPLILRGIQRKGITKGEPQKWGFGFPVDDGLVRGGIVTAVDRAVVDAVRLGKWMISVQGLLWGIKNLGLQASNSNVESITGKRLTKVWTPINTIASTLGGFVGLHPRRHGILPLPEAVGPEKYEFVQKAKKLTHQTDEALGMLGTGNRLVGLYNESFFTAGGITTSSTFKGAPFLRLQSLGGPNSLYGLIPGGRVPHRDEDTRFAVFDGFTIQNQYNPIGGDPSTGPTAGAITSTSFDRDKTPLGKKYDKVAGKDDGNFFNLAPDRNATADPNDTQNQFVGQTHNNNFKYEESRREDTYFTDSEGNDLESIYTEYNENGRPSDGKLNSRPSHTTKENPFQKIKNTDGESHNIEKLESSEIIKGYETIAYGNIPDRIAGDREITDFRKLLTGDDSVNKKRAEIENYKDNNIAGRVNFGKPGKLGLTENRYDWFNITPGAAGNTDRYDKVNAANIGDDVVNDLVHLHFQPAGDSTELIQFRGAVSGITDTFSPSWDSFKYNGRADQAYKYSSFERSLSFNIQVYATSRIEMIPIWQKLARLASMTMPVYSETGTGYNGVLLDFTLGSLYKGETVFIESLSYTMSDETPWEISMKDSKIPIGELPMGIDVSIGLKVLGQVEPHYGQKFVYGKA